MGYACVSLTMNLKYQYHVKETLPSTTSLLQVLISSKELRRQALTACLGVRATGVGRDACLSLLKMAARQEEAWRPLPREGVV